MLGPDRFGVSSSKDMGQRHTSAALPCRRQAPSRRAVKPCSAADAGRSLSTSPTPSSSCCPGPSSPAGSGRAPRSTPWMTFRLWTLPTPSFCGCTCWCVQACPSSSPVALRCFCKDRLKNCHQACALMSPCPPSVTARQPVEDQSVSAARLQQQSHCRTTGGCTHGNAEAIGQQKRAYIAGHPWPALCDLLALPEEDGIRTDSHRCTGPLLVSLHASAYGVCTDTIITDCI